MSRIQCSRSGKRPPSTRGKTTEATEKLDKYLDDKGLKLNWKTKGINLKKGRSSKKKDNI
jgi:hypothetical protein